MLLPPILFFIFLKEFTFVICNFASLRNQLTELQVHTIDFFINLFLFVLQSGLYRCVYRIRINNFVMSLIPATFIYAV